MSRDEAPANGGSPYSANKVWIQPQDLMLLKCGIRDKLRWYYVVNRASSLLSLPPPFGTARGPIGEGAALGGRAGYIGVGGYACMCASCGMMHVSLYA